MVYYGQAEKKMKPTITYYVITNDHIVMYTVLF